MSHDEAGAVVFVLAYAFVVFMGICWCVSTGLAAHKEKHRHIHKLDPQDLKRIDENSVQWFCWECEETIIADCGNSILIGHDVVKRPNRSGNLWGSIKTKNEGSNKNES